MCYTGCPSKVSHFTTEIALQILDQKAPAFSTGAKHLKYFLAQQQQQNQTIKNISSNSRLPDFFQKDALFFIKLHIQVYHVLESCTGMSLKMIKT